MRTRGGYAICIFCTRGGLHNCTFSAEGDRNGDLDWVCHRQPSNQANRQSCCQTFMRGEAGVASTDGASLQGGGGTYPPGNFDIQ